MYLLDTNLISEIRKLPKGKCNHGVEQWVMITSKELMFTNAVMMMAIERKDKLRGEMLRHWFEFEIKPAFDDKILKIDEKTTQICTKLHIPDHAPENDAWIAACAIQHNLTLVTRNSADFARTDVNLFNPFEG